MYKSALAVLGAALLALPAFAQVVRITEADGRVVQGELLGYEAGRYRVRLPGGNVEEVPEVKIKDIYLVSPVGQAPGVARDTGVLETARAAFERNDLDLAFQKISEAMRSIDDDRTRASELTAKIAVAYLDRLLEQKDSARFTEGFRQVLPALTPATRRELFQKMTERLADLERTAPESAFTAALSEALAGQADGGTLVEESRTLLCTLFVERAQKAYEKGDTSTALTLLHGALKLDPKRSEALKGRIVEIALARARTLLEKGDATGAAAAARDAVAADPQSADAAKLLLQVEVAAFRSKLDAEAASPELAQSIRDFMKRNLSPGDRDWAEKALARATSGTAGSARPQDNQLSRYFPIKAGRFLVYRRGDGEFTERLHTDSVVRDGEILRVFNTLKEIYRDYSTTKAYLVEIQKDTVYLPTTTAEREPLLRFPCQPGDSWTWQVRGREFKRTVRSLGDSVVTGREATSRVFHDCLVVDFTSTVDRDGEPITLTSRSSYAPGVGLVKLEFLSPEYEKFNLELIDSGQE